MNIMSINIQGLGHKSKKEWIRELNNKHNVNFLALQETKLERVTHMDVKLLWGNSNYQFIASDSVGSSGEEGNIILQVLAKVGTVAYKPELPQQLSQVHNTFHVSNLKRCLSDELLVIPLGELRTDDKLHFVEEPVEVMDREIKQLKRSRIPIIKVRWNFKRGPEFTWEREDSSLHKSGNNMPPKRTSAATKTARAAAAAPMTVAAVEQLVADRVSAALANHDTLRNSINGHGDGSHNSGTRTRGATRTP
ncbi:putative reverse transcriptase domain-containing protein, partial [Tanacetum coccineum]